LRHSSGHVLPLPGDGQNGLPKTLGSGGY